MKRFFSLLVALVLAVSMFALPVFAFAEGDDGAEDSTPARAVTFDKAKFAEYVIAENPGLYVEMGSSFSLNQEWLKDMDKVKAIFGDNINYITLPEEDEDMLGDEEHEHTITYKAGDHAKGEQADTTANFHATEHVTLKASTTFEADEGYEFIGWLVPVEYDGTVADEPLLYRAGDKFAMPDEDVEIVAYWYLKETANDDESSDQDQVAGAEDAEAKKEFEYPVNDKIYIEYCSPSDEPRDDDWSRTAASGKFSMQTSGWWLFRYIVVDGEKEVDDDDAILTPYNTKEFKEGLLSEDGETFNWAAFCLIRYAVDTTHPEVALSSSMKTKMEDGLTVGDSYSISTSLTITDSSSTSVTYTVWRYDGADGFDRMDDATNKGNWVQIYDSAAKEDKVLEGGESYITTGGAITPISSDVTSDGLYRYKIVYSVKDANGYFGVEDAEKPEEEFHPTLYLGVHLSDRDKDTKAKMEAWKIVLFVIAGLSAIGIVVLLVIKPKEVVEGDTRVAANGADAKASDKVADSSPNEQSDGDNQ